jgi:hypothetical protein
MGETDALPEILASRRARWEQRSISGLPRFKRSPGSKTVLSRLPGHVTRREAHEERDRHLAFELAVFFGDPIQHATVS